MSKSVKETMLRDLDQFRLIATAFTQVVAKAQDTGKHVRLCSEEEEEVAAKFMEECKHFLSHMHKFKTAKGKKICIDLI